MNVLYLQLSVLLTAFSFVCSHGLQCWHCIADDCNDDPADNYKASKKSCGPGQSCQKVYFEMVEELETGNIEHRSVVRGCSAMCESRNDFENCSYQLRTTRGCVRKDCCSDGDLCNQAPRGGNYVLYSVIMSQCLVGIVTTKRLFLL